MRRIALALTAVACAIGCSSQPVPPESTAAAPPAASETASAPAGSATDEQDMIALATSAAPPDIGANATVVEPGDGGQMKQLRAGTNGWVCMAHPEVMCLDKEWQNWADAWMKKTDPQIKAVGIGYMLKGDKGASNVDPYATAPTADNQWIASPPHIMVLTPDTRQLDALSTDPHNGGPWVMWKGTKYAHIMVPIEPVPPAGATANPSGTP